MNRNTRNWLVGCLILALVFVFACAALGVVGYYLRYLRPAPMPVETLRPTPAPEDTPTLAPTTVPMDTATPVPMPTLVDTPVRTTAQPASCMTDSEVMAMFGFPPGEVVRTDAPWDSCKWNRQIAAVKTELTLVPGWGLTYTDKDGDVWTTLGTGQSVTVKGYTLRQPGANQFLLEGPNGYFNKEWNFGFAPERGSATYATCPDSVMASQVQLTTEQAAICAKQVAVVAPKPTAAPTVAPKPTTAPQPTQPSVSGPSDPAFGWNANCFNATWLSANIGGNAGNWTTPDWDGGSAVYKSKGTFVPLAYPNQGVLVVWIDGPVEINGSNASLLSGRVFDEASFHCAVK